MTFFFLARNLKSHNRTGRSIPYSGSVFQYEWAIFHVQRASERASGENERERKKNGDPFISNKEKNEKNKTNKR